MDEPRNWKHAEMVDDFEHPAWLRIAVRQEADEIEARYREALELAALESPEAEEARWSSRMAHAARDREVVHYDGSPMWGRPA